MVALDMLPIIAAVLKPPPAPIHCTTQKCYITVKFTGHSRSVGPKYTACLISHFWAPESSGTA
jgi:hypothetical protein